MRLQIQFTSPRIAVPFRHLPKLVGALHKWIGQNEIHDSTSLYSFSWLNDSKATKAGLHFPYGSSMFFSAHDKGLIDLLIKGIQKDPVLNWGMEVRDLQLQHAPIFEDSKQVFKVASPVLARQWQNENHKHLTFEDEISREVLTETFRNKLKLAGLPAENASVYFDSTFPNPKTKVVCYRKIGNKASICPVVVEGTPEQIAFAWNVGVGHSTGIGFGALGEII